MTYLELVNGVMRRIREEEVSGVALNTYSKMIGDFVNDAKRLVETAWDWSGLKTTVVVNTVADTHTYSLLGSKDDIKTMDVSNDTSGFFVPYRTSEWFRQQHLSETTVRSTPEYYTYNGLDANGDSQVDLYPVPDNVYQLTFRCVLRNPVLTADVDVLRIPWEPVLHFAVALAARERGETGGTSTPEYFAIADKYLSDAIALDAQKHPYATDWYTP